MVQMSRRLSKALDSNLYICRTNIRGGSSSARTILKHIPSLLFFIVVFSLSHMGDQQRQMFRFRLPWLSAATTRPATPRPAAETQPRTAAQTPAPSQPSTTIPIIQRPPFRPAGIAPVQTTTTQVQAVAPPPPPKTEPQPAAAASLAATEPTATSQPLSPPRSTNQVRAASVPPSISRRTTETQTQVTPQTRTPPRAPTQTRAASVPPSSSLIPSQSQPIAQAVSKQQSPSRLETQPTGQISLQPSSPSRKATQEQVLSPKRPPTATQERPQPPTSTQPPPSASQETPPIGDAVKPSQPSGEVKEVAAITTAARETHSAPLKPKEREERKKVAGERRKATPKGSTHEDPEQRTTTTKLLAAATEAGTKPRALLGAALETGKRHEEKQEGVERKKTWTTSSTDEKQIKAVSSTYPKEGSTPSHQKHASSNWERVPLQKEIREDISKFVHKLGTGQTKLLTDEKSISVLTLAGENRGATFHLGSESSKKDALVHIHRGYKINPDDSPDATTDGEGSSRGKKAKDSTTKENPAPRAYVNSNTQCINNSVVFESSVNERNPGVHLEFLHNLESTKSTAKPLESRKAEFNITPAERLIYEPTVRRRCLRGLFAESSDSDPDNPDKPRRHGCRYSCGEKNKEKEIEAL